MLGDNISSFLRRKIYCKYFINWRKNKANKRMFTEYVILHGLFKVVIYYLYVTRLSFKRKFQ